MPTLEWALLCDSHEIDAAGKLNLLGEYSRISSLTFPTVVPPSFCVTKWTARPGENISLSFRLRALLPTTANVDDVVTNTDSFANSKALVSVFENFTYHYFPIGGAVLPSPGEYAFEIFVNNTLIHTIFLPVIPLD
jgi:hypothetical protein